MPGSPIVTLTQKGIDYLEDHNLFAPRGSPGHTKIDRLLLELASVYPQGLPEYKLGNRLYWGRWEKYNLLESLYGQGLITSTREENLLEVDPSAIEDTLLLGTD